MLLIGCSWLCVCVCVHPQDGCLLNCTNVNHFSDCPWQHTDTHRLYKPFGYGYTASSPSETDSASNMNYTQIHTMGGHSFMKCVSLLLTITLTLTLKANLYNSIECQECSHVLFPETDVHLPRDIVSLVASISE